VPPLRARLDDVAELAHYFLFRFDRELGLDLRAFAPEALEVLQTYSWPGNVRELQSAIKQAMLNASGHLLLREFLPEQLWQSKPAPEAVLPESGSFNLQSLIEDLLRCGQKDLYAQVVQAVERVLLPRVLRQTHGHQAQASELLGLNRATLRQKLRTLGMAVDKVVAEEPP
jgi:two-component system nitrogen regulation response regulator GlnG